MSEMRCMFEGGHELKPGDSYVMVVHGDIRPDGTNVEYVLRSQIYCKEHWDYCIGLIDKLRGAQHV
jgi:hypothetical protein